MPLLDKLYFRFRHFFASRWPQGYGFCENHKSVVKFLAAGCVSGGADLVFLYFFHGLIHWPIVLATSVAFIHSFFRRQFRFAEILDLSGLQPKENRRPALPLFSFRLHQPGSKRHLYAFFGQPFPHLVSLVAVRGQSFSGPLEFLGL